MHKAPAPGELASMGPRSIDRGGGVRPERILRQVEASMGPRSIDRGGFPLKVGLNSVYGLQWGRDQLIAEGASNAPHHFRVSCFNGAAIN